ncbi:hypothetical protein PRNP1_000534 [Phytophthora ramorum]
MASLGVKRGELALFTADGRVASTALVEAGDRHVQVIHGSLRAQLQPLGLSLLQRAGVKRAAERVHPRGPQTGVCKVLTVDDPTTAVTVQDDANPQAAGDSTTESAAIPWLRDEEIAKNGCVCMLTSGSVGTPTVVPCTWEHMLLQGESTHQQLFPKGPARIICGTSISHAFSINTIFALFTSPYDAQSELCFASSAVGLYTLLAQPTELFTALYATPGTYTALAAMPSTALHADVPYCAGTRLPLALFRKMRDEYGLLLMQNYGSTEMGDMAAWYLHGKKFDEELQEMESNEKQLYVGSVWPGVETRTEDNGEVTMKTPWQSVGYVKEQELHRFNESVHHTSDLGIIVQDTNGVDCVWLQGRLRPAVEVEWQGQRTAYFPNEIEAVIVAHPGVSDALVLIQSEANRKEGIVRARVVLEDGAAVNASDLKDWCVDHDLSALRDALVVEMANFLPCSPAGKLMYA